MGSKKQEIILLLRDFMNFLPSGAQEAFVPIGSGGHTDSWPLSAESERRMDLNSETGENYFHLERALTRLNEEHPLLYEALLRLYLHDTAGHRDVDHIRNKALVSGSQTLTDIIERHDDAIEELADYLEDVDLYVKHPAKASGPKPGQKMEERHNELFNIFLNYIDEGIPYRQSIKNARFKMTDHEGKPYYSLRHAERIIKLRWEALNEKRG